MATQPPHNPLIEHYSSDGGDAAANHRGGSALLSFRGSRAFTIIELMVSIAIIFILVTAVAVALKKARGAAQRVETLNALRQMMVAYNSYADANNGALLPGFIGYGGGDGTAGTPSIDDFIDFANADRPIVAKLPHLRGSSSTNELLPNDSRSYVWRLAPYLNNAWKTYMVDYRSPSFDSARSRDYDAGLYGPAGVPTETTDVFGIAERPSFGLNSIFLGGDSYHGGSGAARRCPWAGLGMFNRNSPAASRMSQVKSPPKQIVFAPSEPPPPTQGPIYQDVLVGSGLRLGHCELRPPLILANDSTPTWQWTLDADGKIVYSGPSDSNPPFPHPAGAAGVPVNRHEGDRNLPIGFLDGSTRTESIERLGGTPINKPDMSMWSPFVKIVVPP